MMISYSVSRPALWAFFLEKNEFSIFASILYMYSFTVKKHGKILLERKLPVLRLIEA